MYDSSLMMQCKPSLVTLAYQLNVSSGSTLFTALCIGRSKGYYHSEITSGKYSNRSDVYSFGVVSNGVASYPGVQGGGGGGKGKNTWYTLLCTHV